MKKIIALSLLSSSLVFGLELKQMVQETIETNPKIKESFYIYKASKQDLNSAKAGFYPTLNFDAKIGPEYTEVEASNNTGTTQIRRETNLVLTQNLFEGFKTMDSTAEQRSRVSASAYNVLDQANQLSLRASEVYINYLREKELLVLAEEYLRTHEKILKKIVAKTKAGLGKRSDVEQTKGRLALANANYFAQRNNFIDAQTQFTRVYGHEVKIKELKKPKLLKLENYDFEPLEKLANEANPSLLVVKENINIQNYVYEQSKAAYYPTVDAELKAGLNNSIHGIAGEDDAYSAMLKLNYNLFRGGSDEAQRVKNQILISKEKYTQNDKKLDVAQELRLSLAANKMLSSQIKFLTDHSKYTMQAAKSYNKEYNLGRRNLIDVLNAELEYNSARQSLVRAKMDLQFTQYRILAVTGQLLKHLEITLDENLISYNK